MRRILPITLVVLLPLICTGFFGELGNVAVKRRTASGSSEFSFLVSEGFEGTGAPSGWSLSGSGSFDGTGTVLSGAQSLEVWDSGNFAFVQFAAQDEVWTRCMFRTASITANNVYVCSGRREGVAWLYTIQVAVSTGAIRIHNGDEGSVAASSAGGVIAANTTYYIWTRYKKGSGANAEIDVYVATTLSRPASPTVSITTGTGTQQMDGFYLRGTGSVFSSYWDDVRIAASPFQNEP